MNIKERFYANLNMIREDYDHVYKSVANQLQGYADKDKKNRNKNPTNQKWYKLWSSGAKRSRKKAVTGMDEEAEQLDAKKKYDKKDKLFLRSRKMIAVSKLDRNRNRNKDNRSTPDLSSKIKKNLKTSNLDRNRNRNKNNRQD